MTHRIMLVGRQEGPLSGLTSALRREDHAVMAAEIGQQAGNLARQFRPSVVVLVAPEAPPQVLDELGVLATHPATSTIPLVAITRPLARNEAISAFQHGVAGLVYASKTEEIVERLDAVLGSSTDKQRRAAALDRRGPAVLRRIATYLRGTHASGTLNIQAADEEAVLPLQNGVLGALQYGDLSGNGALQALFSHPDVNHWRFNFEDAAAVPAAHVAAAEDDSLEIDITDEGMAVDDIEPRDSLIGTGTLLLVDDDPALLEMYRRFLARAGFTVETATDGRKGFAAALARPPDVIVSDIMMPDVDGWGFLTDVRGDHRLRETRFLLLSCHTDYVHKLRDLEAGADDYLEKGLRADEIVARVTATVEPRQRLLAALERDDKQKVSGFIGPIGIMWLLEALGDEKASGKLIVDDGIADIVVELNDGQIVKTSSERPGEGLEERKLLLSLAALEESPFTFEPGGLTDGEGPLFSELKAELCVELNTRAEHERQRMLEEDAKLVFHDAMLAFYRSACPDVVRVILDELVEGASPQEAIAKEGRNAALAEWVIKDLLRKHVAHFAA